MRPSGYLMRGCPLVAVAIAIALVAGAVRPPAALPQGFDASCWLYQQSGFEEQVKRMTPEDRAKHAGLISKGRAQAKAILDEGQDINKRLDTLRNNTLGPAQAQMQARLGPKFSGLDHSRPSAVRQFQRDAQEDNKRVVAQATKDLVGQPAYDQKNAESMRFQNRVNREEQQFAKERRAAGISAEHQKEYAERGLQQGARQAGLTRDQLQQARQNPAWSQALQALGVATVISNTGRLPRDLEFAGREAVSKAAQSPFDGSVKTFGDVADLGLIGKMTLDNVGRGLSQAVGDQTQAVDVRKNMGPQSREAVSAGAATALRQLESQARAQQIIKDLVAKGLAAPAPPPKSTPTPPPPPVPSPSPSDGRVETTVRKVEAAVLEAARQVQIQVFGAPIILPAQK